MLLIREVARLLGQAIAFSVSTRRIALFIVLVLTLAVAVLSAVVVKAAPVAIYPFL